MHQTRPWDTQSEATVRDQRGGGRRGHAGVEADDEVELPHVRSRMSKRPPRLADLARGLRETYTPFGFDSDEDRSPPPATRKKPRREPIMDDEQPEYAAKSILREKGDKYRIAWHGDDPATGKPWAPTWEPKEFANEALVEQWELVKAKRLQDKLARDAEEAVRQRVKLEAEPEPPALTGMGATRRNGSLRPTVVPSVEGLRRASSSRSSSHRPTPILEVEAERQPSGRKRKRTAGLDGPASPKRHRISPSAPSPRPPSPAEAAAAPPAVITLSDDESSAAGASQAADVGQKTQSTQSSNSVIPDSQPGEQVSEVATSSGEPKLLALQEQVGSRSEAERPPEADRQPPSPPPERPHSASGRPLHPVPVPSTSVFRRHRSAHEDDPPSPDAEGSHRPSQRSSPIETSSQHPSGQSQSVESGPPAPLRRDPFQVAVRRPSDYAWPRSQPFGIGPRPVIDDTAEQQGSNGAAEVGDEGMLDVDDLLDLSGGYPESTFDVPSSLLPRTTGDLTDAAIGGAADPLAGLGVDELDELAASPVAAPRVWAIEVNAEGAPAAEQRKSPSTRSDRSTPAIGGMDVKGKGRAVDSSDTDTSTDLDTVARVKELALQLERANRQRDAANAELADHKDELAAAQSRSDEIAEVADRLRERAEAAEVEREAARAELDSARARAEALEANCTQLVKTQAESNADRSQLVRDLRDAQARMQQLENEVVIAQAAVQHHSAAVAREAEAATAFRAELLAERNAHEATRLELSLAETSAERNQDLADSMLGDRARLAELTTSLAALTTERDRLAAAYASAQSDVDVFRNTYRLASTHADDLQRENTRLTQQGAQLRRQLEVGVAQVRMHAEAVLRQTREAATRDAARLRVEAERAVAAARVEGVVRLPVVKVERVEPFADVDDDSDEDGSFGDWDGEDDESSSTSSGVMDAMQMSSPPVDDDGEEGFRCEWRMSDEAPCSSVLEDKLALLQHLLVHVA